MPAGLTVDADTGAIRGTPYVVLAETEFSIVPVRQWIDEDDSIADLDYIPQK